MPTFTFRIERDDVHRTADGSPETNQPRSGSPKGDRNFVDLNAWQIAQIEAGLSAADRGELRDEAELDEIEAELAGRSSRHEDRLDARIARDLGHGTVTGA